MPWYLEQSKYASQNRTKAENFENCYYIIFDCYCNSCSCGGTAVHKTLYSQFWLFPNISSFSKILTFKSFAVTRTMFFMKDIKYHFTCGEQKHFWNVENFQYVMYKIVWTMIEISENYPTFAQKVSLIKKKHQQQKLVAFKWYFWLN